ncbi:MAG: PAS domain-containing protein [Dehalococcoidia bacterium]|nr:PAS domain-containing protein [Dehalococcoidia bacterium]HRC62675.1 PAS domain-containing protein [Dehalococcoidia bacterium]
MTGQGSPAANTALLEAIVESAPDGILVVDSDARIHLANRQAETLFQYPRDQLIGEPLHRLLPARYHASHLRAVDAFGRQPTMRPMGSGLHIVAQRRDGTEFAADIALSPVTTPTGSFVIASVRDVSSHQLLQQEHQQLSDRVRVHSERERAALGLQDSLIQVSYGVGLNLMKAKELVGGSSSDAGQVLDEAIEELNNLILRVRRLILDISGAVE